MPLAKVFVFADAGNASLLEAGDLETVPDVRAAA
jgi:hypothetical protein